MSKSICVLPSVVVVVVVVVRHRNWIHARANPVISASLGQMTMWSHDDEEHQRLCTVCIRQRRGGVARYISPYAGMVRLKSHTVLSTCNGELTLKIIPALVYIIYIYLLKDICMCVLSHSDMRQS